MHFLIVNILLRIVDYEFSGEYYWIIKSLSLVSFILKVYTLYYKHIWVVYVKIIRFLLI